MVREIVCGTAALAGLLTLALWTLGALERGRWILFLLGCCVLFASLCAANAWSWKDNGEGEKENGKRKAG